MHAYLHTFLSLSRSLSFTHTHTHPHNHTDVAHRLTASLSHPHTHNKNSTHTYIYIHTHTHVHKIMQTLPADLQPFSRIRTHNKNTISKQFTHMQTLRADSKPRRALLCCVLWLWPSCFPCPFCCTKPLLLSKWAFRVHLTSWCPYFFFFLGRSLVITTFLFHAPTLHQCYSTNLFFVESAGMTSSCHVMVPVVSLNLVAWHT